MKNNNFQSLKKPSLLQTIAAVLTAGIMWGSGNVIVRSLLIEGLNEIVLDISSAEMKFNIKTMERFMHDVVPHL